MSGGMVWKMLSSAPDDPFPVQVRLYNKEEREDLETEDQLDQRFQTERNEDHLMGIPFECDLSHLRNVTGRDQIPGNAKDDFTLLCI